MRPSTRQSVRDRVRVFQRRDELADFVELLEDLAVEVDVERGALPRADALEGVGLVILPGQRLMEANAPNLALWPPTLAVVDDASKTLVRHLNRMGVKRLLKRPIHPRTLRLLLLHQIYRGPERRARARIQIGHPVRVGNGLFKSGATLLDLSNTGARIELASPPAIGSPLGLVLGRDLTLGRPLKLKTRIVRCIRAAGDKGRAPGEVGLQILDARPHAQAIQSILDRFALGPACWAGRTDPNEQSASGRLRALVRPSGSPAAARSTGSSERPPTATPSNASARSEADSASRLPPVHRPSGEDVDAAPTAAPIATSDPVESTRTAAGKEAPANSGSDSGTEARATPGSATRTEAPAMPGSAPRSGATSSAGSESAPEEPAPQSRSSAAAAVADATAPDATPPDAGRPERRQSPRQPYDQRIVALDEEAARIFVGRDLSLGGMRIEPHGAVATGDVFRLALHGSPETESVVVTATVLRDEGEAGLVLGFEPLTSTTSERLRAILTELDPGESRSGPRSPTLDEAGRPIVVGELVGILSRAERLVPHGGPEDDAEIEAYLDAILDPEAARPGAS